MKKSQRLFHFSENPSIELFTPRERPPIHIEGRRLQESVVWAIDEWHSPMYFFPRDCPRMLLWPIQDSSQDSIDYWMGEKNLKMVAYMESGWKSRFETTILYRYEFEPSGFESLNDAGMHVSTIPQVPVGITEIAELGKQLGNHNVELRFVDSMQEVSSALTSSLHYSAIRMRNATEWTPPI